MGSFIDFLLLSVTVSVLCVSVCVCEFNHLAALPSALTLLARGEGRSDWQDDDTSSRNRSVRLQLGSHPLPPSAQPLSEIVAVRQPLASLKHSERRRLVHESRPRSRWTGFVCSGFQVFSCKTPNRQFDWFTRGLQGSATVKVVLHHAFKENNSK